MMAATSSRAASRNAPHRLVLRPSIVERLAGLLAVGATRCLGAVLHAARRNLPLALTLASLAALCGLQGLALLRAPAAWLPSAITIDLAAGNSIILGQRELAAPQTDRHHLSLRRDANGSWLLRNLSASGQVVLIRESGDQRLGSAALQGLQRFQIDGAVFDVHAASDREVSFTRDGQEWRYDGAVLYRNGRQQPGCPESRLSTRVLAVWNRIMPLPLTIARPLSFGGNLYCDNRLGLAQVAPGAAQIARVNGSLQLSGGNPDGDRAAVLVSSHAGQQDLRTQEASLAGVTAIAVGRTRFHLNASEDQLVLQPSRHVKLFSEPELKLPSQVSWQWQQRSLWSGAHADAIWIGLAICAAAMTISAIARASAGTAGRRSDALARRATSTQADRSGGRTAWACALLATVSMLLVGLVALISQRAGDPPSAACSLLLGASALLMWLALPGRLTLATAAGAILLAAGLLAQLELGLAAPESSWLRFYQKSAAMLAIGAGLGGLLRLWAQHQAARGTHLAQRNIEWILALFAAIALAALAAQVLWGDETGVFDLQPVELAKLALTALTAHCLALRFNWHNGPQRLADHSARWLQLIAPALLFLALLGLALVQVDDFSPLILLLVWSTGIGLAYALAAGNRMLAVLIAASALLAVATIAYLRLAGTDDLIRWGFYADRFLVWLNPAEHPHTGQQLLLGARAVGEGGWFGTDHWLGLRTLGQAAGNVVNIPAVQDDFAASFFLNRHGLLGGLLLWTVQAAFLTGIVLAALHAYRAGTQARNFRHAWLGRFRYFALSGGAAFVFAHFLLSWGTNLAIFPIMGQPMSFLSAGGSHLLFFLCPLLTFVAISTEGV
ncbi:MULTISPECIES: FtsW/RodA/SpoVE family cell cycle protein [unclassified Duganella]|uniref:FtsW/RodA/SpoVE family cell cycle protein n=1 Tax=unclassified Duganella TaxID=2636909 RepID=UPI00088A7311|nr:MULTISPECIES: FtsW/RodA/SpoVE family cell cycle protein [unclassified Duganella]SDF63470.1 cell division protein FtsW, lipid II flippase [Duganella sp. OV458]SDI64974.1 cell division protein FtsW [Duganella sp. OV510]